MRYQLMLFIILLPLISHTQDISKYKYQLDNRILNEILDLNSKWLNVKVKGNFKRVYPTQKEKDEILLDDILNTPQKITDTLNKHTVYFKALNEKTKYIFGEKFNDVYVNIDISQSLTYSLQPGGNIHLYFIRNFNNKQESKIFFDNLYNKVESITKKMFYKNDDINQEGRSWNYLSYNNNLISIFSNGNSISLDFSYLFMDDSWPKEISYNEFSENFKLYDELLFFNGFRLKNTILNYSNVLKEVEKQANDSIKVFQIQNNNFKKRIGEIQFDDGYILTKNDSIYRQVYFINKNEFNKINIDKYFHNLNILISEYGFGFFDIFSKETRTYYWCGNRVIISFEYNIIDEDFRLSVDLIE